MWAQGHERRLPHSVDAAARVGGSASASARPGVETVRTGVHPGARPGVETARPSVLPGLETARPGAHPSVETAHTGAHPCVETATDDNAIAFDTRGGRFAERVLGDFTFTRRALRLALIAPLIGVVVTALALGLLELIGLITHLVYTGTVETSIASSDTSVLGVWSVFVPPLGGLVVGAMAKLGSERIRGHGIPEAMETILLRGSRMEPRLAVLKPVSSAVSIGTGGPFGAEGPIIVTGGAVGSIVGQLMHLTAAERRCLLVGGAAAGMTAVFGTPLAAVLLAVELLLFEWRPRALVPVALAACSAEVAREALVHAGLLRAAPLFPIGVGGGSLGAGVAAGAVIVGGAAARLRGG